MFLTHGYTVRLHTVWFLLFSGRAHTLVSHTKAIRMQIKVPRVRSVQLCNDHAYCWVNNLFMHLCSCSRSRSPFSSFEFSAKLFAVFNVKLLCSRSHIFFLFVLSFSTLYIYIPLFSRFLSLSLSVDQIYIMTNAYLKICDHFVYTYTY